MPNLKDHQSNDFVMESAEAPVRLILPAKALICTKRAVTTGGRRLPDGNIELLFEQEMWYWTFYFEGGEGITFCTGDIAPPSYKPRARIVLEIEPYDQPKGPSEQ